MVVGNKIDLRVTNPEESFVSTHEGLKFTEYFKEELKLAALFIETSAKTGENIQGAFAKLLDIMIAKKTKG